MKITGNTDLPAILSSKALIPSPDSDLFPRAKSQKQPRRRARNADCSGAGVRLKRNGASAGRRSRPETPLHWKLNERDKNRNVPSKEERPPPECRHWISGRKVKDMVVSARKLGTVLWRLQSPEVPFNAGLGSERPKNDWLGFQFGGSHIGMPFLCHHTSRTCSSEGKDQMQSPHSVSTPRNGYLCKFEPPLQFSNSAMEGKTKWDPICFKTSDEVRQIYDHSKHLNRQISNISAISALKVKLEQAQTRIQELESERQSSKKKLDHFLKKLSEERASWRSREHEKIHTMIKDMKVELNWERKNRQKLEVVNSKLLNEVADAKALAKLYIQDFEKERKARELIEEVCDELAKEIGEDKCEVEALKRESMKLREEVEEERKMLQMAEVWREERVQMKLVDAKVTLEDKYSQMNMIVEGLENFLSSRSEIPDLKEMTKAEILQKIAASVNIEEIKEFAYEPSNPNETYSIFEDANFSEGNERDIEQTVGFSPASHASKVHTASPKDHMQRHHNACLDQTDDMEEDESGWETVSHPEDQGSCYSLEGSDPSVNKSELDNNLSGSGRDWEENACRETPITEISEVSAVPKTHLKKASSVSRLWRSYPKNGENFKIISVEGTKRNLSNGRLSNGATMSPDRVSGTGMLSPPNLVEQWRSPDLGIKHTIRRMKWCIERAHSMQKSSLKARLLEARTESQKIQLRQVLNQNN